MVSFEQLDPTIPLCRYVYVFHITLLSNLLLKKSSDSSEPEDVLWEQINPDLDALLPIIANHFGSPCQSQEPLQRGAYARTFLYILLGGLHVVARVILPARRTLKTEAEVAAMDSIRGMRALLVVLVSSDPWLPSAYVNPRAACPPVLQHA